MDNLEIIKTFACSSADEMVKDRMHIQFERRPRAVKEDDRITLGDQVFYVLAKSSPLLSIEAGEEDIKVAYQARSPQASLHMLFQKVSYLEYEVLMEPHHIEILNAKVSPLSH